MGLAKQWHVVEPVPWRRSRHRLDIAQKKVAGSGQLQESSQESSDNRMTLLRDNDATGRGVSAESALESTTKLLWGRQKKV
jgi:hypothetical protein